MGREHRQSQVETYGNWYEVTLLTENNDDAARRVIEHALADYKVALQRGDVAEINAAWRKVAALEPRVPDTRRRRMRTTLKLLRYPVVSRSAFALRRVGRPVMLWAFSA